MTARVRSSWLHALLQVVHWTSDAGQNFVSRPSPGPPRLGTPSSFSHPGRSVHHRGKSRLALHVCGRRCCLLVAPGTRRPISSVGAVVDGDLPRLPPQQRNHSATVGRTLSETALVGKSPLRHRRARQHSCPLTVPEPPAAWQAALSSTTGDGQHSVLMRPLGLWWFAALTAWGGRLELIRPPPDGRTHPSEGL